MGMRARGGPILWFIIGGILGFSALDLVGFGAITLLPAAIIWVLFLVLRIPGLAMSLVGAGTVMAVLWTLHITSGNTPDSDLWPVLLGLVFVVAGLTMFLWRKRANLADA
jgi:hypothetical protein